MPTSSARVEAWKSAWESRDPARVVALYTRDATHQSALIAKIYPELGRLALQGHHEIGVYARRGLERFPEDTVVHPGHGPATTLGRELQTNPFLRELRSTDG